jgi:hypothetical protein
LVQYNGYCRPEYAMNKTVPSDLATFNKVLKTEGHCARIYQSGDSAPTLLSYSRACALDDVVGVCQDPHGMKSTYESKLNKYTLASAYNRRQIVQGSVCFAVGALMFLAAAMIICNGKKLYPVAPKSSKARRAKSPKSPRSPGKGKKDKNELSPKVKKSKKSKFFGETSPTRKTANDDATADESLRSLERSPKYKPAMETSMKVVPKDIYLAPLPEGKPMSSSGSARSKSRDAPGGAAMAVPMSRAPSFAVNARNSNLEAGTEVDVAQDRPWAEPSLTGSSSRPISVNDAAATKPEDSGALGGIASWFSNSFEVPTGRENAVPAEVPLKRSSTTKSTEMRLPPLFLANTEEEEDEDEEEEGYENEPEKAKANKLRRFMALRRKTNN